ncbi:hypothetical protein O6H91_09G104500 [Diphasiastrum complanatum]|uniref:Uncharacterized protein n=1 Tax=Diphasiastrum complanatum TaxID=34168 RepID=A0ACC2CSP1_DIPCM|nr:hypothetical protein O6H91_09G104500 [Diphasiastrum complanatum]
MASNKRAGSHGPLHNRQMQRQKALPAADDAKYDNDAELYEDGDVVGDEEPESVLPAPGMKQEGVFAAGSFHDLGLAPALADHIQDRLGFKAPTHVQQAAIPSILSGRDVLVNAETGTGKTIVYLAPILSDLQAYMPRITRADGTFAIVLVPTRELCIQVFTVAQQLVHRFYWLVPGYIMGGENRAKEKARLRKGITILIATPGRLLDHLKNTASFCYASLQWLVFDEADRLLDLGFEKDVRSILDLLESVKPTGSTNIGHSKFTSKKRQNILLSATLSEDVNELATLSLKKPIRIGLEMHDALEKPLECSALEKTNFQIDRKRREIEDESSQQLDTNSFDYNFPAQLTQSFIKVPCRLRLVALLALLRGKTTAHGSHKLVVFFSTCDAVDFHFSVLNEFNWSSDPSDVAEVEEYGFMSCEVFRLHGNIAQKDRTEAFFNFGKAESALLLCTDVAARGLDFQGITSIIQYDAPGEAAEYVHRVGRTARLGKKGEAVLFLQPCESDYLRELQKHGVVLKELFLQKLLDNICATTSKRKRSQDWENVVMHRGALVLQNSLESFISSEMDLRHLAVDAFRSYIRAYAAHRGSLKSIFQIRNLHLGHVAKSFGLKDAPSLFGKSSHMQALKKAKGHVYMKPKKRKRLRPARME